MEQSLVKQELEITELENDVAYGVAMGVIMFGILAIMAPVVSAFSPQVRVPVLSEGISPIASNVGLMWIQAMETGPRQLRMIVENSTGAFEAMLIGLST